MARDRAKHDDVFHFECREVLCEICDQLGLGADGGVSDSWADHTSLIKDSEQVDDMRLADGIHFLPYMKKKMIKAKNAFYSCVLLIGTVLGLYGIELIPKQLRFSPVERQADEIRARSNPMRNVLTGTKTGVRTQSAPGSWSRKRVSLSLTHEN